MLETPAAALSVPSLRKYVDFFSIGSNDLAQYTMAAGRENPMVTEYFIDDHPTVLRLIELAVRESVDTPVSLCGELAGRIDALPFLLKTGIRSLSVAASLVPSPGFVDVQLSTFVPAVLSKNSIPLENFGPQSWSSVAEHEPGMELTAHSCQYVPSSRGFSAMGVMGELDDWPRSERNLLINNRLYESGVPNGTKL
jgi:hypothetical protein